MQPTQAKLSTIRVLLVDDHPTILWGLMALIQGERPRMEVVGSASNVDEAFAATRTHAPHVVLLDLDLGGKSSLDILPDLLANPQTRVLVLTGTREQSILDLAVQRGARGILKKDASGEQIIKAITKVHQGELWLDRESLTRVFNGLVHAGQDQRPDIEQTRQASLTAKERTIVAAIVNATGATNKVLADQLFISEHTLRNHLSSIYQKLQVSSRLGLYVYASKYHIGKANAAGDEALT